MEETLGNQFYADFTQKFYCKKCDFVSSKHSDYLRHISTLKHKRRKMEIIGNTVGMISDEKNAQNAHDTTSQWRKTKCDACKILFKTTSGLWKHKKKCKVVNDELNNTCEQSIQINNVIPNDTLIELLKQNNEFKELIVDQNKMIIDLASKVNTSVTNINTMNNCNNNTMNNKFNLNVFLNETCKDAININDFVKSLQITSADFEKFGKNGFVEGISNIMVKGLNKLELCKRPIHCSDLKRETIHLKEDNGWAKETDDGSKLKKVIRQIKHKNIDYTDEWKEENPEYKDFESKVHERYMKIINESMGGYNIEEDEVFYNKIIKNVAKETVIKK